MRSHRMKRLIRAVRIGLRLGALVLAGIDQMLLAPASRQDEAAEPNEPVVH